MQTKRRLLVNLTFTAVTLLLLSRVTHADDYGEFWFEGLVPSGAGLEPSYIGDLDGDGQDECIGARGTSVRIIDLATGGVEWTSASYSDLRSITLIDIDADGTPEALCFTADGEVAVVDWRSTSGVDGVGSPLATASYQLFRARPNPFNPRTTIVFDLGGPGDVDLKVYDVSGRLIRQLVDQRLDHGRHEVQWDGRDANGRGAASGTYFYRLFVDGVVHGSQKAILVK